MTKKSASASKTNAVLLTALICLSAAPFALGQTGFTTADYNLALRMTLKFFGGQRCGDTHNWMLVNNPETGNTCHLRDRFVSRDVTPNQEFDVDHNAAWIAEQDAGYDVTGGWHDCGDHIKVATTMGYAAVALLTAYDVWPRAFEDNHSQTYGPPNGIADVLDEVKIATDFFMKSFPDENTFVYYVGHGSYDHREWVTSAFQSTRPVVEGGDPRPSYASTTAGGAQAANYASALALMAKHYPDKAYSAQCSTAAVKIYKFARKNPDNISIPEFYGAPNDRVVDEHGLMCVLLYKLTGELSYLDEIPPMMNNIWESNSAPAWDTVADLFYYYMVTADPEAHNGNYGYYHNFLRKNVRSGINDANSYGIPWDWLKSKWGTNKLASGSAFAAALYAKLLEDGVIDEGEGEFKTTAAQALAYNKRIVEYMMGANEFNNHPFIHGFKDDMTHRVHHRNAMGRNDNPPTATKNIAPFLFPSGALIGGPAELGVFEGKIEGGAAYVETESGCDYNAPYVAAIANIVQTLDPKEVVVSVKNPRLSTSNRTVLPSVKLTSRGLTLLSSGDNNRYGKIEIFSASGRKVYSAGMDGNGQTVSFKKPLPKAMYIVRLTGQAGIHNMTAIVK